MDRSERGSPPALSEAWTLATTAKDPLVALGATRAVRAHLSEWESRLAAEAIASGHTWESIGQTLGMSRQAAWDRFHDGVSATRKAYERKLSKLRAEVDRLQGRARGT